MMEKLEDLWTDELPFEMFDNFRLRFREASADLVRRIISENIHPTEDEDLQILEIGSGLGELVRLVPELEHRIQQTEQSQRLVELNRNRNPGSNVMVANVYDLPFAGESFSGCVAYSVFDTLIDLNKAFEEVYRVLMPEGKFIHFLDMTASSNTFFRQASKKTVLFPWFENEQETEYEHCSGIQAVKRSDLSRVRTVYCALNPGRQWYFDKYLSDPENGFIAGFVDGNGRRVLHQLSEAVKKSKVKVEKIDLNKEFIRKLEESARVAGFDVLNSSYLSGRSVVPRDARFAIKCNLFHGDCGTGRSRYDPSLGEELGYKKVCFISTVHVMIAQKYC